MHPSQDIETLLTIMERLRNKDNGCPWDIEQTFSSIVPYTIEEAYEVMDAIERNDMDDLREELGDLLLQVIFHAQMASEEGHFHFGDVVNAITKKMIRRHPHVFGTAGERGKALVREAWEKIKAEEKAERAERRASLGLDEGPKAFLDDVPYGLPPMKAAVKLQKRAGKVGFDWNDPLAVLDKIEEEIGEVRAEIKRREKGDDLALKSEIGDVLFAVANLARHADIDPDEAIAHTNQKFRRRFGHIERELQKAGSSLDEASLDEMEVLWQQAKAEDRSE